MSHSFLMFSVCLPRILLSFPRILRVKKTTSVCRGVRALFLGFTRLVELLHGGGQHRLIHLYQWVTII